MPELMPSFAWELGWALAVGGSVSLALGALACRALPALSSERSLVWLFAPLIGLAVLAVASTLLFSFVPLTRTSLLSLVGVLGLLLGLAARSAPRAAPSVLSGKHAAALLGCSFVLGLVPCLPLLPVVIDGGLYTGIAIHDHTRIAFIDSIARDGIPPVNPLYAPGATLPLHYYYVWLLLAAQLRVALDIPGWPADVALTWLTWTSTMALAAGLASRLRPLRRTGYAAIILLAAGPAPHVVPLEVLDGWLAERFVPLVRQATWSPHHVSAAAALVLALALVAHAWERERGLVRAAPSIGVLLAFAVGCSAWVTLAFVATSPALGLMLLHARPGGRREQLRGAAALVLTALLGVVLAVPSLAATVGGPCATRGRTLAFELYRGLPFIESDWLQLLGYWLLFVPLVFAVVWVPGLAGLFGTQRSSAAARSFQRLSAVSALGVLVVCQFLRSVIFNNDLGVRAHSFSYLLLSVWGAVAWSELSLRDAPAGVRLRAWAARARPLLLGLSALALLAGLYAMPLELPTRRADQAEHRERQLLLGQARAFAVLRRFARPDELVQSNPHGFETLLPWPINLDYLLFADRRSAFANPNFALVYCKGGDVARRRSVQSTVTSVFGARPSLDAIRRLRDELRVRYLLVHRNDAAFESRALDDSGVYAAVHVEADFKIYGAMPRR